MYQNSEWSSFSNELYMYYQEGPWHYTAGLKTCVQSFLESESYQFFIIFNLIFYQAEFFFFIFVNLNVSSFFFQVTHVSIVLVTKDFNPEKYEILCRILLRKYRKSGNPALLLESYLSVLTRGSCSTEENGRFSVQDYDVKRSYANTKLKGSLYMYCYIICFLWIR